MDDQLHILATLDEYAEAYCAKDLDRLMTIFAPGEAISLIGPGGDELCAGRAAVAAVFARSFREATATRFDWGWSDVAVHGDAATVAIALVLHLAAGDAPRRLPIRWTVALVRTGAGWKWIHCHASVAAGAQAEGSAYPAAAR